MPKIFNSIDTLRINPIVIVNKIKERLKNVLLDRIDVNT